MTNIKPIRRNAVRLAFACVVLVALQGTALAQAIRSDLYVADGDVLAIAASQGLIYIGGDFTQVGPATGCAVPIDLTSGAVLGLPKINGTVNAIAPDGTGGWYVGGKFTNVGGVPRQNIAHIQPDNTVSSWDPGASSSVFALALDGMTLYVGGGFTSIGGQPRQLIAALDAATGLATSWDPSADFGVRDIEVRGAIVYASGTFTTIGGQSRSRIAELDAVTGLATAWNPATTDGTIYSMAVSGNKVYIGGRFTLVGGLPRNRLAALDLSSGLPTAWDPDLSGTRVRSVAMSGGNVYAGGLFNMIGDATRSNLAAIDTTTGSATSWDPSPDQEVRDLMVNGSTVYVGGVFSTIGGQARNRIAAVSAATGLAAPWDPNLNDDAYAIAIDGSTVYVGGAFTSAGGSARAQIAVLDAATGAVTAWDPGADATVRAIAVIGNTVLAGGDFTTMGGQARNRIAALDAETGLATAWDSNADNVVRTLVVSGSSLYVGGDFTNIGGNSRSRIAELDLASGFSTAWDPGADGRVYSLAVNGNAVYAGGSFNNIGGQLRRRIAAIDATTGLATGWDPGGNGTVYALIAEGNLIYVGGQFFSFAGQSRGNAAAIDATTGLATPWDPDADEAVYALAKHGNTIYAGGCFTSIGGQGPNYLAALDATSAFGTAWNAATDSDVWALAILDRYVYAGGAFIDITDVPNSHIAGIAEMPSITSITPSQGGSNGSVSVVISGAGFQDGATAALTHASETDIAGTQVVVSPNGTRLTTTFDLSGALKDPWDVEVANPDLLSATLSGGFDVVTSAPHQLRVDVIGPPLMRSDRPTAFDFVIENRGNNDVLAVPLWISGIPDGAAIDLAFTLTVAPQVGGEPDWSLTPLTFEGSEGQYLVLVIPRVTPGVTVRRIFLTVPPAVTSFDLDAAITPPWVDSAPLRACLFENGVVSNPACMGEQLSAINSGLATTPGIAALSGISLWAKHVFQCEGAGDLGSAVAGSELILELMLQLIEGSGTPPGCLEALLPHWQDPLTVSVVGSFDPNDKFGVQGHGEDREIAGNQILPYSIRFENLESATAAAQDVVVVDVLDATTMDFSTVSLGPITFGNHRVTPPPGISNYTTDVDLRPANELIVRVGVSFDQATGVLAWTFNSIDPVSGLPPADPLAGFLAPNVNPPEGEGSLLFTVMPKAGLANGTEIVNGAIITFDDASPIVTPTWLNTIDDTPPESQVLPLPNDQSADSLTFTVHWQPISAPPDLRDVSVYVAIDGGEFRAWRLHSTATADTFAAEPGHTYAFYSVARDSSGNLEDAPISPDAQTATIVSVAGSKTWSLQLEGAHPNPASGAVRVWFTLPKRGRATLAVIDVAGRRVLRHEVGQLGPGRHMLDVSRQGRLAPGLYFLRLAQGKRMSSARMVVIR